MGLAGLMQVDGVNLGRMEAEEMEETMLTPEEVAERLKVKPYTVREWLRLGKLKGIKLPTGRRVVWRVRPSDLEAFLAAGAEERPGAG